MLMKSYLQIKGALSTVQGFQTSSVHCGLKKVNKDLLLIFSEKPSCASGVFTKNLVQAAPVIISKNHLQNAQAQAIIINSGNANACTGQQGLNDALEMATKTAQLLNISTEQVLVCSTGVIGKHLDMEKIRLGISQAVQDLGQSSDQEVMEAIMTTDTFPKSSSVEITLGGKKVYLAGIAKGAGMIKPNMATMLCFLLTDVAISPNLLNLALHNAIEQSFNTITIDGDTSTNDTALILANGLANNPKLEEKNNDFSLFQEALNFVTHSLAHMIVQDGEGATKCIHLKILKARTYEEAKQIGYCIAESPLVKTALCGQRCLWGRIMAAIGYAGVSSIRSEQIDIFYGPIQVVEKGQGTEKITEAEIYLKEKEITITIDLNQGKAEAIIYTCDLSRDYVTINMAYT